MRTPELDTISIFSKDIFLNLTINQISKRINKSYAFTNKYMLEFIDQKILTKRVVGSAILCSLNFSNEKTLGLLMLNSIEQKQAYVMDKATKDRLNKLKDIYGVKSVFITKGEVNIICEDKDRLKGIKDVTVLDKNEFKLKFRSIDMQNTIIIEGYESFWRLIAEMM